MEIASMLFFWLRLAWLIWGAWVANWRLVCSYGCIWSLVFELNHIHFLKYRISSIFFLNKRLSCLGLRAIHRREGGGSRWLGQVTKLFRNTSVCWSPIQRGIAVWMSTSSRLLEVDTCKSFILFKEDHWNQQIATLFLFNFIFFYRNEIILWG